jgi:hypothetical protein
MALLPDQTIACKVDYAKLAFFNLLTINIKRSGDYMRYHELIEAENLSPEQYVDNVKAALKQARWKEGHDAKPAPGQFTTTQTASGTTVFSVAVSSNGQLTHDVLVKALTTIKQSADANGVTITDVEDLDGSAWSVDNITGNVQQFNVG